MRCSIFLLMLWPFLTAPAQQLFDIRTEGKERLSNCAECLSMISNKPREIQYGVQVSDLGELYFVVTRKEWFDMLMKKSGDGLAIDIVPKEMYSCTSENGPNGALKGDLQRPYYLKELKKNMVELEQGAVAFAMGTVPDRYRNADVEFNVLFLKNKYLCHYNFFYDLKTYRWDLLDMGLFFDSLTYRITTDTLIKEQEGFSTRSKVMRFEIPFEKNKAEYSAEDIRPLYDSLRLTDFNIHKITIRAYSSVEGDEQRNIELQQQRAESIVAALQSFQTPSMETEVVATENWVDLLNDLSSTSYASLKDLPKTEIKEKLKDKKILDALEPYLSTHRKAVVVLELGRKDKFGGETSEKLIELFQRSIADNDLQKAMDLQNSIFERVRGHEVPVGTLDALEIPRQQEYSLLLNKNVMFKYMMNEKDVFAAYKELEVLNDLIPKNGPIKYNMCALKFKLWMLGESAVDPVKFKNEINELTRYGIARELVTRMLINYEIIMSEYHMLNGEFAKKDKSLKYIQTNYRSVPGSAMDHLSMAQYFASYAKYDWAIQMLDDKVKKVNVDEDLLFYYLNLTLIDEERTKRSDFRTIMMNAYAQNKERYCQLFDTYGKGGISFQLLDNQYLRRNYCENCH